ncbi:MAG TPA: type I polyketide synthase, partial [Longimicrobiaceae bacterium]|nr:type I polyketide synthase [Longimicrobiaceae bacterium]
MTSTPDELTPLQRALLAVKEMRARLEAVERAQREPIAIVGIGCRFPGGADDPGSFWRLVRDGVDAVTEIPPERWDVDEYYDPDPNAAGKMITRWGGFLRGVDRFDAGFFGISDWEAASMDPQQRLFLEVVQDALDDAGQPREALAGSRTGVFVGLAHSEYAMMNVADRFGANCYTATGSFGAIVANRLSYLLDLRGPSYTVDAVCSAALLAVHVACESLRRGECSLAVAGGSGLLLIPEGITWFSKLGVLSPDGRCKAFDAAGDGIALGEGVASIVLKPLSRARADGDPVYAVILGSAVAQDGRSNGLTAPSRPAQETLLREAYARAGVEPSRVHYVEAHGTGTILGDPIEAQALGSVLGEGRPADRPLYVGSVKSNIGHLQMVGGLAGLIKTALAVRHRMLPPSIHFHTPNPHIPFEELRIRVQDRLTPWPYDEPALAGVTSLSFGGTNVHVVVGEAPAGAEAPGEAREAPADGAAVLLPLSAQSRPALEALAESYRALLAEPDGPPLRDVAFTAGARRSHYDHRLAVVGHTAEEVRGALDAFLAGEPAPGWAAAKAARGRRRIAFVFPGQGSQWVGMGRRLVEEEPVFRAAVEACERAFAPHVDWSLAEVIATGGQLERIDVVQPTLFALQTATAALWRSWGVEPEAVVGHSMGEVAAAHVAGALSLEDAARVICLRSRLLRGIAGRGAMAVVEMSAEEAQQAIAGLEERLSVAVSNSPRSCVLSGEPEAIEQVLARLSEENVFCRRVQVDVASHSPQVEPLLGELMEALAGIRPRAAEVPFYSTVTGRLEEGSVLDAAYWGRNLREPVRFAAAVEGLLERGHDAFVEVSPHPVLVPALEQTLRHAGAEAVALPSGRREEEERAVMLATLGALYARGCSPDWRRLHPGRVAGVELPTYPWQRERYWLELPDAPAPGAHRTADARAGAGHPLLGRATRLAHPARLTVWEARHDARSPLYLDGHRFRGTALLPESALLELALAAGTELFGGCELAGVRYVNPLFWPAEGGRVVQAVAEVEDGGATLRVHSRPEGDGDAEWTLHLRGTLRPAPTESAPYAARLDPPEEVEARCGDAVTAEAYYAALREG